MVSTEPTYEIGIPVRSNLDWALETTKRALSVKGVTSVHVSVNDPSQEQTFRDKFTKLPAVRLSIQDRDLGLYGNLRFLANSSRARYFSWLCLDDIPDREFFASSVLEDKTQVPGLWVPQIAQQDFDDARKWHGPTRKWPKPESLVNRPFEWGVFFGNRTHYIYGVWETEYLRSILPARNFDWLDAYLVSKATLDRRIKHVESGMFIVGISDKLPNRVGRKHELRGWLWHAFRLVLQSQNALQALRWYLVAGLTQMHINHYWNTRERAQKFKVSVGAD